MSFESTMDNFRKAAAKAGSQGKDKFKEKLNRVESWARENSAEAKQKLMAEAREHGIEVKDNMDSGEIKNRIKAKLRNKLSGV